MAPIPSGPSPGTTPHHLGWEREMVAHPPHYPQVEVLLCAAPGDVLPHATTCLGFISLLCRTQTPMLEQSWHTPTLPKLNSHEATAQLCCLWPLPLPRCQLKWSFPREIQPHWFPA